MPKYSIFLKTITTIILYNSSLCYAQTNSWTLISGSDSSNIPVAYVALGKATAISNPGAREGSASWVDANNNLWLYGGITYQRGLLGWVYLNDLWQYNMNTGLWKWVNGGILPNQAGNYGTKGAASTINKPWSKTASSSWTDNEGNLWLFGGAEREHTSFYYSNDLWKYTISSRQWTWVNGDSIANQPGVFGTKGIGSTTNTPGARTCAMSWTDKKGIFWLFGGCGPTQTNEVEYFNDLWKYNSKTNEWTWVNGDSVISPPVSYGTKGIATLDNMPRARVSGASWVDKNGNLWLFGGSNVGHFYNDLWKYDIATNEWTWIKGSDTINQNGTYGMLGVPADTTTPGAREHSAFWTDANGDFWLWGGQKGCDSNKFEDFSDLWKYNISSNEWVWVSGSNIANNWGSYSDSTAQGNMKGMPVARNKAIYWTDANNIFWLYGGETHKRASSILLNSLWKYTKNNSPE